MTDTLHKKNSRVLLFSYLGVCMAVLADQLTKYLAASRLKNQPPFVLIPKVFELQYLENESAAFSLDPVSILHRIFHFRYFDEHPDAFLNCKMAFFVVITLIIVTLIVIFYSRVPWNRHFLPLNLVILGFLAGAAGNLIDRVTRRYVIDFFYFRLINFPVFNVADIYVTLAAFGLIACILFVYSEEDLEQLPFFRRKGEGHGS